MSMSQRDRIAQSFNRASATYDEASELQKITAQSLASRVLEYPWDNPNVLEVGCGTGGLTNLLLPRLPGNWIISDIAPAMLNATRSLFPNQKAKFHIMDGENPDLPAASLDLIVSNLAAQWFGDLHTSLERLSHCLAPRGRMIITTLGQESLVEWRNAVDTCGYKAGTHTYPTARSLIDNLTHMENMQVSSQKITIFFE